MADEPSGIGVGIGAGDRPPGDAINAEAIATDEASTRPSDAKTKPMRRRATVRVATVRRFVRHWWVPGIVLLVAVAASLSVFFLEGAQDLDARQDHALGDVAAAVNRLSAGEWEGIAELSVSSLLSDRINQSWSEVEAGLSTLQAIAPEAALSWDKLSGLIAQYRATQADELALVKAGRYLDADAVDRTQVDPAFSDLAGFISELRTAAAQDARQQATFTRIASVAAIVLSLSVVALLVRRASASRRPKLVARG